MISAQPLPARYGPIATAAGAFAMVAVDQRESLRVIMSRALGRPTSDDDMRHFKAAVIRTLSGDASGILVDPLYGLADASQPGALHPECGLIVSVDHIEYDKQGAATRSEVDLESAASERKRAGAVALKFLLIWSQESWFGASPTAIRELISYCRAHRLLSLVETVVRERDGSKPADEGRQAELLVEAAREIGGLEPDLYKTEVPYLNTASASEVVACSREITEHLSCPWVVLSSGVDAAEFPDAVLRACQGGASGFLAGRAIWGPAISSDIEKDLDEFSLGRLRDLREIADNAASARYATASD